MGVLIALSTVPDDVAAERIARALVDEKLAACVNRIPNVTSTFRWNGAVTSEREVLLVIKTTTERFAALRDRLVALHPYELPELIAVDVAAGLERYLEWIGAETRG